MKAQIGIPRNGWPKISWKISFLNVLGQKVDMAKFFWVTMEGLVKSKCQKLASFGLLLYYLAHKSEIVEFWQGFGGEKHQNTSTSVIPRTHVIDCYLYIKVLYLRMFLFLRTVTKLKA